MIGVFGVMNIISMVIVILKELEKIQKKIIKYSLIKVYQFLKAIEI